MTSKPKASPPSFVKADTTPVRPPPPRTGGSPGAALSAAMTKANAARNEAIRDRARRGK